MTVAPIPITSVHLGPETEALVLEVLRSGMLAQGPKAAEFEQLFAEWIGVDHAIAVNNGTTALVAALQAAGIGPGDEVITSPFTFVATLNAILEAGATARFADIDADDFLIDPATVVPLINDRTRAIMPVHLYGQAADIPVLAAVTAGRDITLVEDAAQAHGATIDGRAVGTFGIGCFSLYATKNFTTGEGGLVTTNDSAIADQLRLLRNQGMRARYQYEVPGHNYRMTDLQAAVGIPQIRTADAVNDARRHNAAVLSEGLADVPGLATPVVRPGRGHVFHQYTIRVTADAPVTREAFMERLVEFGIGHGIYYPKAVYDYDCYRSHPGVAGDRSPVAERVASQVVSLPVHPNLSEDDLARIVESVRKAAGA